MALNLKAKLEPILEEDELESIRMEERRKVCMDDVGYISGMYLLHSAAYCDRGILRIPCSIASGCMEH